MQINSFAFSGNYIITDVVYDSGTPQELNLMRLAREDGAKLISSNYTPKEIQISGMIKGTSVSNLETNIDTFKKSTLVTEGSLDTGYAGGFRRYTVDCSACTVTRKNYMVTYALFELKYIASDPPFAEEVDSVGGTPLLNDIYSFNAMNLAAYTADVNIDGTARPKPVFNFVIDTAGNLGNISIKNVTSNTQIDIYTAYANADQIEIDTEAKSVMKNQLDIEYEGIFPDFELGDNDLEINLSIANSLDALNETYTTYWSFHELISTICQSFQPLASTTFNRLDLLLKKASSGSSASITVRIETDSGTAPSGTLVHANATATITEAEVGTDLSWVTVAFTAFSMTAGTTYWIVLESEDANVSPKYWALSDSGNPYASGIARRNGTNYTTADFAFMWYVATASPSYSIDHTLKYTKRYL